MAIVISNTNYTGEVLESLLTLAATGNQLVDRGLIRMEPGVSKKFFIPRIKGGTMLRKRVEQPTDSDSKGDFTYSERALEPKEFMAFTTFNPRSFESVWRKFQPKGNLVFAELPAEAQNALLAELAKCVDFELGGHMINGQYAETGDSNLFNGFVYRINADSDKVVALPFGASTMIGKLQELRKAIPATMRSNPGLRILMSQTDADKYDDELTSQAYKGSNWTDGNPERYKGIAIEALAQWPDNFLVATITGDGINTNLWAACNLSEDEDVIQIDKLTNAGEKYFFKMLMKMDTNTAFGEELVVLDTRGITLEKTAVEFAKEAGDINVKVHAEGGYTAAVSGTGFTVAVTDAGVKISATSNASGSATRTGTVTITMKEDTTVTKTISLSQLHE